MTCPFCGAGAYNAVPNVFKCGTESCYENDNYIQSDICRELCQLRDKKAEGLTWEYITCDCYEAKGFNGTWRIIYDSQSRCFDVFLDGDFVKETKTRIPREAKAHAEELHQQAWRELRNKWDAV